MNILRSAALLLTLTLTTAVNAQEYNEPTLIFNSSARDGYNMPARTFFTDRAPSINDDREMAITLTMFNGTYDTAIWVKSKYQEGVLVTTGSKESYSDVQINNNGDLTYAHQTLDGIKGVYTAKGEDKGGYKLTNHMDDEELYAYTSFDQLKLSENDELFFTAKNFKGDLGYFNYHVDYGVELIEAQNQRAKTPYSFLFSPSFNIHGQAAYKARLGKRGELENQRPDQIILSDGTNKKVLIQDKDSDPASKWLDLRNSVALSNSEAIAFIGKDQEGEKLVLLESSGEETILASAGVDLKEFSFFSIVINDKNWVAFRGIDLKGRHALYVATKKEVKKVLTQFDTIKTPWGEALIAYGPHIPFGGSIDMNNHGDIIVNTGLANLDNTDDYGNGLVVIYTK